MEQEKIETFFHHILLNNFFYYQRLKKGVIQIFFKSVEEITHNVTTMFLFCFLPLINYSH